MKEFAYYGVDVSWAEVELPPPKKPPMAWPIEEPTATPLWERWC